MFELVVGEFELAEKVADPFGAAETGKKMGKGVNAVDYFREVLLVVEVGRFEYEAL